MLIIQYVRINNIFINYKDITEYMYHKKFVISLIGRLLKCNYEQIKKDNNKMVNLIWICFRDSYLKIAVCIHTKIFKFFVALTVR